MTQDTHSVSPPLSVCLKPGAPTPAFSPSDLGDTHPRDVARASRLRVMAPSRCQSPTFDEHVVPENHVLDVIIFTRPTPPVSTRSRGEQTVSSFIAPSSL